jgi:ATP-binding cassette subfamily B protein
MFQNRISKYQNLQEFLNTPQTISNGADSYHYKNGDIHLDNVTFSYNEDKQILQDFSLHIPGGKTLALVGNSGSGKSTIIKLLLRLYDPQS